MVLSFYARHVQKVKNLTFLLVDRFQPKFYSFFYFCVQVKVQTIQSPQSRLLEKNFHENDANSYQEGISGISWYSLVFGSETHCHFCETNGNACQTTTIDVKWNFDDFRCKFGKTQMD